MSWYYAVGNDQKGPVTDEVFATLVSQGAITPETLVWREGMGEWQPYSTVAGTAADAPAQPGQNVPCSHCGKLLPADEVVPIGGKPTCAVCKPIALQKLREGVVDDSSERIRREHISHEASIKSIGGLYLFGCFFIMLAGIVSFFVPLEKGQQVGQMEQIIQAVFLMEGVTKFGASS